MKKYAKLISLIRTKKLLYGLIINRKSVEFCIFFIAYTCNFNFLIRKIF
jgi:hypothetical protein